MERTDAHRHRDDHMTPWVHLFLVVLPWLEFWLQAHTPLYRSILKAIFGPDPPVSQFVLNYILIAPFMLLLIVGVLIAWRQGFPVWSYPWIGILFFFAYRQVFEVVLLSAPKILPKNPGLIVGGFYHLIVPLALALLLALITRKDWLLACFTAYPFASIIQAWYTLDSTPFLTLIVSLVLYAVFALFFLVLSSRPLRFGVLLAGSLIIGGGFFLIHERFTTFLILTGRNMLIMCFPAILVSIPLYHRLFATGRYGRNT